MSSWDKETPGSWYSQFSTGSKVSSALRQEGLLVALSSESFSSLPLYVPSLCSLALHYLLVPCGRSSSHPSPPSSTMWTQTALLWAWSSWASCVSWASRPTRASHTTATALWHGWIAVPKIATAGRCTSGAPTRRTWATRPTHTLKPWSMAALWVYMVQCHWCQSLLVLHHCWFYMPTSCHIY